MILPDVNVLIYAFRKDSPDHPRHQDWLLSIVNGSSAYGMSPQVLSSLIRITTHPRAFFHPSRLEEALEFCRTVMEPPQCAIVQPGERHWAIFSQLCLRAQVSGKLIQDAWFAALAIENGCEWVTTDRDYARFPGLRWRSPFYTERYGL